MWVWQSYRQTSLQQKNGIRFAITPGSDDTFNAHDVARMFPNLRLFILLGPDRSEAAPRTLTDRLVGNQMRAAAHELFNVAAPAVISIPGLPSRTTLVEEVLQIFAKVFTSNPTNAVPRLQTAVRDQSQDTPRQNRLHYRR